MDAGYEVGCREERQSGDSPVNHEFHMHLLILDCQLLYNGNTINLAMKGDEGGISVDKTRKNLTLELILL